MNWSSPPFLYIKFRKIHVDATENSKDSKIKRIGVRKKINSQYLFSAFVLYRKDFDLIWP
jgi:ribosomal protein L27